MSASRRLLILRHGETDHNAGGVWQGQLDIPLSDIEDPKAKPIKKVPKGSSITRQRDGQRNICQ